MNDVVILGAKRTPIGGFQGVFSKVSSTELGAAAIRAALDDAGCDRDDIDEVVMGQVLSAGAGQAPARQASLGAGVGKQVPATAVSKVCGSGMKSICQGVDAILAHSAKLLVAGGMESMTASPYLLKSARSGARLGHTETFDHMFLDGLEDAYEPGPKACPHALQSRVGQRMRKSQAGSQLRPSQPHKNSCAKSDGRSVRWIFGK